MKKLASLLLTVALLATMFCVFSISASAETVEDYMTAGAVLKSEGRHEDAADAYMKAGECYEKAGDFTNAAVAFNSAASQYNAAKDDASAAEAFIKAGKCFEKANDLSNAKTAFGRAALAAQDKVNKLGRSTGSTLSEGSLTIIVGIACLAVGFLVAMFIFKKKKPALASGENTDEE